MFSEQIKNKPYLKANILAIAAIAIILIAGVLTFAREDLFIDNEPFEPRQVSFEAKITEAPDVRDDKTILVLKSINLAGSDGAGLEEIRVTTDNLTEYEYGEYIVVEGELKKPENFADFDWVGYLAKEGVGYVMHRPDIEKTGHTDKGAGYIAWRARQNIYKGLQSSLLPPHSSLYSAMLIGHKSDFTESQREILSNAGLSHITAISGMHIAIITYSLFLILLGMGLWRHHASYAALVILIFYIFLIGAPASAVRASVMAGILVLAQSLGRPNSAPRALLYAAAVMVIFNPLIIRYDIGFQLSFLAVSGILFLKPRLDSLFERWRVPAFWRGRDILSVTLSAQAFTFPVVFYNFGAYSPLAPVANIFAVAALPFAVGAGFLAALGEVINFSVLAGPAWILSEYIWAIAVLFG